ncbi:dimethylsulfoniopropionate demethylase [Ponticoccus sp. SC2-23]|uniref:dimethylsulfoniopropionate demethylase n=1 Tax=Alexandriicola marinus TaxID=2081710 RepID=UPI000FD76363|nr:dimethylsulfoniopropionate demethylase [Alexandriicola marinus]MBM1221307.1 dimethylsulfoniopropionate demethylase [Ponticoccus sp. SC6-9]MBM1225877.1 dimethylsulfoniopropionate demethylase [Ponticoccus sp. SC6-15]MBM1228029.1 dimethylsulfoniopropionate demethylase [Ponticoccus sp. SC6-38]MBM1234333.1 dimethylsulfoniopropionate demethylase [Ponticoccus sp. SC6-45]MBM1238531.1 dimethylsulfoniopropionate demethylase [Ponticoccus sp. SC6-49]MBM1243800.1 dimethylsulfoniopropionate demethylase 
MRTALLSPSRRVRRTPFSDGVEAAGVKAYTVYNHMLLPTVFRSVEEDYRHLKEAVQIWDVACERQVELRGPDAGRLVQILTPRDLRPMLPGQCYYIPIVDETGGMLNDPVAVKLAEDRWWISIADSDLLYWIKGLAYGYRLDVLVDEPDVSPLAVQGPRADDLMAAVFGDVVRDIRFFRFMHLDFEGRDMVVARSGYSKQGGFEIYVEGEDLGMPLWNALMEAGRGMDVHAGCPNLIERVESGLLSYGNDMTDDNTPHECGLGRFCNTQTAIGCIGRDALLRVAKEGPVKQIRAISIDGDRVPLCDRFWPLRAGDKVVGRVSSAAWSPDFDTNVAIGMVRMTHWDAGTELIVDTPEGPRQARVNETFWN